MMRLIKAALLAWIGKKVFDAVTTEDEPQKVTARAKTRGRQTRAKHA